MGVRLRLFRSKVDNTFHAYLVIDKQPDQRRLWSFKELPKREYAYKICCLTLRGPCIVIYSYNKSQRDALFFKFILIKTLHVSVKDSASHQMN
jgi:hypothetical protein